MTIRPAFSVDFENDRFRYDRKDGVMAVAYAFYLMAYLYLVGWLMFQTPVDRTLSALFSDRRIYGFLSYIVIDFFELLPIFIYLKIRKQKFRSLGFKKEKIIKSILLGALFSFPFVMPTIVQWVGQGRRYGDSSVLVWQFFYFFLEIALVEEIAFRGFIQTRIQGLIKNKGLGILAVGFLFSMMHIPFQMQVYHMSLVSFVAQDAVHLAITFGMHLYFVYLYTRDQNILAPAIAHTLIDYIQNVFV